MDTDDLVDGESLREVAASHGFQPRTLTKWRALGLLPRHVEQVGHQHAGKTYLYPPESLRQLERLIYWKRVLGIQTPPHRLGWALWCDGFDSVAPDAADELTDFIVSRFGRDLGDALYRIGVVPFKDQLRDPRQVDSIVLKRMPDEVQELIKNHDREHWRERIGVRSDFETAVDRFDFSEVGIRKLLSDRLPDLRRDMIHLHQLTGGAADSVPDPALFLTVVYFAMGGLPLVRMLEHFGGQEGGEVIVNAFEELLGPEES